MTLRLVAATVLLVTPIAFAQGPAPAGQRMPLGPMSHMFGPMREPVTNAPYSATFISTFTQKLQDGTVLTHTSTRTVARDSLGRVREEITGPSRGEEAQPHTMVVILDPVAKTVTSLDTERKVAVIRSLPEPRGPRDARWPGRVAPHAMPPDDDAAPAADATAGIRPARHKDVNTVDLGSKTIAGVVATGTRTTRTVPANAIGNTTSISTTHEAWYSPDLRVEVARTNVDPFRGTDSMTVSTLTKAEPAAALFKVPEGFTTRTAPQRAFGRRGFDGPGGQRDGKLPPPPPGM